MWYTGKHKIHIGSVRQTDKLEFVGELGIDSLRRGRVSRPFAQQPIYRFAPPFWEIFPLAAGGETPPLRPYKLEFDRLSNSRSLRASAHPGVAIPRIDVPLLVDKFQKTSQKNGLYDDKLPGIRWRFPHQFENWFGMTRSDDAPNSNFSPLRLVNRNNCVIMMSAALLIFGPAAGIFYWERIP